MSIFSRLRNAFLREYRSNHYKGLTENGRVSEEKAKDKPLSRDQNKTSAVRPNKSISRGGGDGPGRKPAQISQKHKQYELVHDLYQ